ncbi:MAG: hypothetical protein GVY26_19550 [Bacteroidetes bacterium]|jgi:hypothetical protein|nr:hypothetical protein [Bacteroidota bacterium]
MEELIKKLGITNEHIISIEKMKFVKGGANLHCSCTGGVSGCWYYPGTSGGNGNDIPVHEDLASHCETSPGANDGTGACSYTDRCAAQALENPSTGYLNQQLAH